MYGTFFYCVLARVSILYWDSKINVDHLGSYTKHVHEGTVIQAATVKPGVISTLKTHSSLETNTGNQQSRLLVPQGPGSYVQRRQEREALRT